MKEQSLEFGKDYYFNEDGFMVFTAHYLKERGYCCGSGCRHCPYGFSTPIKSDPESEEKPE